MAWRDERPGGQLRPPLAPAPTPRGRAPGGRDREGLAPPVSARCHERGASGVGRLARPQDLESGGSTKVVTCEVFVLLPPSDLPPRRPPRNSADVVIPSPLPCS